MPETWSEFLGRDTRGKGKARIFSESNVVEFAMFDFMSKDMSIPQLKIKYILDHLKGYELGGFGWGLTHNDIQDFFTGKEWGISKELTYENSTAYDPKGGNILETTGFFHLLEREYEGEIPRFRQSTEKVLFSKMKVKKNMGEKMRQIIRREDLQKNLIWLGAIRNIAIKRFDITI